MSASNDQGVPPPTTFSYSVCKKLFQFTCSVFFRQVDVLNLKVLPATGPVIIVGNHANQFVDAMNLVAHCPRSISFLIAQKSWDRRYIGDVAKAMRAVPVTRPQDLAKKGKGRVLKIVVDAEDPDKVTVHGDGSCNFAQMGFIKGAKLRAKDVGELQCIEPPTDDNVMSIKKPKAGDEPKPIPEGGVVWQCMPKIDQKVVFNKVFDVLAKNGTIGIFPEGGSHDQGQLIPLKAGVTIMALGAAAQGTKVKIVPAGLTYFHAHRWRSKAVVQFGVPFECEDRLVELYKTDSRAACGELLEIITRKLKEVTINTANFQTKKNLEILRRLYQPDKLKSLDGREYMAYSKKFTNGFERMQETPAAKSLLTEIEEYRGDLDAAGWKEKELHLIHRVKTERNNNAFLVSLYMWGQLLLVLVLVPMSIPGYFLNAPILVLSKRLALKQQKKALAESKVKVGAFDVVASEIVKWGAVFVPLFYSTYIIVAAVAVSVLGQEGVLLWAVPVGLFVALPIISFYSIKMYDVWHFSWKKFRAMWKRNSLRGKELMLRREELQKKIRQFVSRQLAEPTFGGVYGEKDVCSGGKGNKVYPGP